jgi:hypothetical protein
MVSRGRGRLSQPEAIRDLVSRLSNATSRRERSRSGTREFREAEDALLRYRHILLDDELFERFIGVDDAIATDGAPGRDGGLARAGMRSRGGAPQRLGETRRRG